MNNVPAFSSASEAVEMVRAGLGYLAGADATQMVAEEQARCLRALEQISSIDTAARTSILGAFTAGQGYLADTDYSPRAAECREAADAILIGAAGAGMDLRELAGLAREIYDRSRPDAPDEDEDGVFEDRSVTLQATFDGAAVLHGDLTRPARR